MKGEGGGVPGSDCKTTAAVACESENTVVGFTQGLRPVAQEGQGMQAG